MKREIKFRAWSKANNVMHQDIINPDNWSFSFIHQDIFIWMQYIGLKDKNENYIYEGDILKNEEWVGSVVYKDASFKFDDGKSLFDISFGNFEVTGNIYQNITLLKNK